MDFKTMLQLPVLSNNQVLEVLQEIAAIERIKERPKMPQVTISTHSDNASGFFVNYDSEKKTILLCDMYDGNAQFKYISAHSISSISISSINPYAYLLSDGKIPFVPEDDEIPTALVLKRNIKDLESELKTTLDKEISIVYNDEGTPEAINKYFASKVLLVLKETFSKIAVDSLAKQAFANSISKVEFNLGTENKTSTIEDVLFITIDTSKALKSFPKAVQLQEQIEKYL